MKADEQPSKATRRATGAHHNPPQAPHEASQPEGPSPHRGPAPQRLEGTAATGPSTTPRKTDLATTPVSAPETVHASPQLDTHGAAAQSSAAASARARGDSGAVDAAAPRLGGSLREPSGVAVEDMARLQAGGNAASIDSASKGGNSQVSGNVGGGRAGAGTEVRGGGDDAGFGGFGGDDGSDDDRYAEDAW
jgi:hypothetical protein